MELPQYDDLPLVPGSDLRCAWGVFGSDDQLGTLNHLTGPARLAALGAVRTGEVVNLTLPLDQPDPPLFRRRRLEHEVFPINRFSWDDRLTHDLQASTQWDGLLHVRHGEFGFYGGRTDDPIAGGPLGVDQWVRHGLVGRGVLLDLGRYFSAREPDWNPLQTRAITATELRQVAAAQQVELRAGDVLCLRFGWVAEYLAAGDDVRQVQADRVSCTGLSADADTARLLWDNRIAAVAADNPSVESMPGDRNIGFLHHRLLTMFGMPLGELFDFEELAHRCADRGRWDFLFVSNPLHLPGAIGSPGNAAALL